MTDAQRAATDFCDALISQPSLIDVDLASRLHAHWSHAQIVEHALDVMKWSYQKVAVVLGADPALARDGLTDLVFDDAGNWVR